MTIALTAFILSFIAMAGMVLVSMHRLTSGKQTLFIERDHKLERYLRGAYATTKRRISYINHRTFSLLFHATLDTIESVFLNLKNKTHRKVSGFVEKAKGRETDISNAGVQQTSEFISNIKEHTTKLKK